MLIKKMDISDEQEIEFRKATRCSICNKNFKPEDEKVRDHCHFSGNYRGASHVKCNLTDEQKLEFRKATRCSICNKNFKPEDEKVRDHCHFSGKYRGASHVKCNLDYSFRYFKIPIFFHNLKNYDAHLIIKRANELNKELNENKKIDVIVQNSEKFITFSFGCLQFKDSFSFLSASLDKLVKLNKYENNEKMKDWQNHFRYTQF